MDSATGTRQTNSVFVVVIVVRCVAMTIMQIVHVIAMRDGFVSAIRAMLMLGMAVGLVLDTCHTANRIAVCDERHSLCVVPGNESLMRW